MDKFITQYVEPLLQRPLKQDQKKDKLLVLETDLKIFVNSFVKTESATINKQLTKKSRQLFILSSDNQTLKQNVQQLQTTIQNLKIQINSIEQEKAKQRIITEKQILDLNKNIQNLQKQMKKQIAKLKMQKQVLQQSYKTKIRQMQNQHRNQLNNVVDQQKRIQEQMSQNMKRQHDQQKNDILKQNNDKKRQLIKKYEDLVAKITNQYQDKLYLLNKQFQQFKKESKDNKSSLQNKIVNLENNITKLRIQLAREEQHHKKYQQLYKNTFKDLSQHQQKAIKEKQNIEQQLHEVKINLMQQQKKYTGQLKDLNSLFKKTVQEKDSKYTQTVQSMKTEFRIQIQSLETRLVEQREVAVCQVQIKRDKQNYDHQQKYNTLKQQFQALKKRYDVVSHQYEQRIAQIQKQNQDFIYSMDVRKNYELQVTGKNAQRQFNSLRTKYELQIKAIYNQHSVFLQELARKHNDEKIALTNKLTTQYQSMINDQRASNQIQIKQKLIQFERKSKGYEAKLKDAEKKKSQMKVAAQRIKMQMQMRVDSMVQLNQVYETQIASMNEKIQNAQRQKEKIINQYQLKILIMKNQMKATTQQFEQRQTELKSLLESKLLTKNQQISKILARVKKQTQLLVQAHQKRVQALQKEYNELKRVIGQKTSLPEDIEVLKVFHDAYIQKQKQVQQEKIKVEQLYRQLRAKDAIDKVFAQKGSKKIHKNYGSTLPTTLISFKSNQI